MQQKRATPVEELKAIREEIGLSMRDFADILQISKPAYQGYETGRRSIPPAVMDKAEAQLLRTRAYWAGMDARAHAAYPHGIISAPVEA